MKNTGGKKAREQGKRYEREFARWSMRHCGGIHPSVKKIASKTGRVGHYYGLEIDGVFVLYSMEAKSKTTKLPKWLSKGFYQALHAAEKYENAPLITWYFGEFAPKFRRWHTITQERHAELLECERKVKEQTQQLPYACSTVLKKIGSSERALFHHFTGTDIPEGWERDDLALVKISNDKVRNKKRTDSK